MIIKEVPVENISEALRAVKQGANRIELCENLTVGGTTPSYGTIKICKQELTVPMMVMIRPRGGDFNYSAEEINAMREDIQVCKNLHVDGIVTGVLTNNQQVNVPVMRELIELARPLQVTFHKAIDESIGLIQSLETLIDLGIDRILTSGQAETAFEGRQNILEMIEFAKDRARIITCGKITAEQLEQLRETIPGKEFHGRLIVGTLSEQN